MSLFARYCLPRGAGAAAAARATRVRGASRGLLPSSAARSGARPSRGGSPPVCICAPSEGCCCLAGGVKALNQGNFTKGGSRERARVQCAGSKTGGEEKGLKAKAQSDWVVTGGLRLHEKGACSRNISAVGVLAAVWRCYSTARTHLCWWCALLPWSEDSLGRAVSFSMFSPSFISIKHTLNSTRSHLRAVCISRPILPRKVQVTSPVRVRFVIPRVSSLHARARSLSRNHPVCVRLCCCVRNS